MGLFKKSDGDDDSNRRALFGSRKKDKSPSTPSNPYAQPIPIDPYTKAKIGAGVAPLPSDHPAANGGPASQSPHAIPSDNKYAPNKYGNQGGYGSDRFGGSGAGAGSPASGSNSRYGNGGYGGLGGGDPNDPAASDSARNELFGGASNRNNSGGPAPPPYSEGSNGQNSQNGQDGQGQTNYGGGSNEYSMATFQDRQLTAEEEEEEEVQATKNEMRFVKQGDVASTRNALRAAAQAEETGRATLARLGAQGESIHDTEKSLDMTAVEGRIAEDKAKELRTLNKSMFAVHVANPFTASRRRRERDEKVLNTHRDDRDVREGTRSEAHLTNQRMERVFRDIDRDAAKQGKGKKASVTERAKYQFEADSEDEAMEDEIEQNLDLLSGATGRLHGLAKATGKELDEQNRHLERIMGKSDYVDDQIAMNRAKLDRIH
ncbi:hypothetical protein N7457_008774 [Penicillium paradoxum]|uniref:uncharacterized protein n=1 Tax=Penicillium paradoxum TaxID=176176 RepID=UPI0025484A31|nr:uncharacterized protein N7457_008774 [Penicillium paradoxum]KAJ5773878.1 hypothetical protein N7457_008774 [Penicillium paradoxum]